MAAAAEHNWLEWSKVTIGFKPYPQQRNCLSLFMPILNNTNTRIPMDITSLLTIPVKQPL